jgi:ATP-dependent Clp protease ATP-binding subunit ClpA
MPETFSRRAMKAILVARLEAGQRGAEYITLDDLVVGLITEDQDPTSMELNYESPNVKEFLERQPKPLGVLFPLEAWKKREQFFPSDVADELLAKLKEILPRSSSIPHTTAMHTSPEFQTAIQAAEQLQKEFHQEKVHPLHLLAAALREPCESTKLLQEAGITEKKVILTIRADLENRSSSQAE